tara:strand:- start:4051 stop:4659 length:609 start_codon:yes stop_codon:yes gene_type:complete
MPVISNFGVPVNGNDGTTLMPKLQYRFRVVFNGIGKAGIAKKELTQNVISVSRPNMSHEEVIVDSYNSKTYLAGKHTWEPVTIVFRDDMTSNVIKALGEQLNKQVDHSDQASAIAGEGYKFAVEIQTLDGNNGQNSAPEQFDTWKLMGCFIQNVQYGELNYATSDMVQVTLTLRYDHAEHIIDNTDVLSKETRSADGTFAQG